MIKFAQNCPIVMLVFYLFLESVSIYAQNTMIYYSDTFVYSYNIRSMHKLAPCGINFWVSFFQSLFYSRFEMNPDGVYLRLCMLLFSKKIKKDSSAEVKKVCAIHVVRELWSDRRFRSGDFDVDERPKLGCSKKTDKNLTIKSCSRYTKLQVTQCAIHKTDSSFTKACAKPTAAHLLAWQCTVSYRNGEKKKSFWSWVWKILPHSAYSPDIASSDYHLFRSIFRLMSALPISPGCKNGLITSSLQSLLPP